MGVRGLTTLLRQSICSFSQHVDLTSMAQDVGGIVTIVVDGNSFTYWMCINCFGGNACIDTDYSELHRKTISWIDSCLLGQVHCIFVFDGPTNSEKFACRLNRMSKQVSSLNLAEDTLRAFNSQGMDTNFPGVQLQGVLPVLALQCVVQAIQQRDGIVLFADGEADKELVVTARRTCAVAILSNDSDILLYSSVESVSSGKPPVGCVPHWALAFAQSDNSVNVHMFQASRVAALLRLRLSDMWLLAALCGHDSSCADTLRFTHSALLQPCPKPTKPSTLKFIAETECYACESTSDSRKTTTNRKGSTTGNKKKKNRHQNCVTKKSSFEDDTISVKSVCEDVSESLLWRGELTLPVPDRGAEGYLTSASKTIQVSICTYGFKIA